VTSKKPSVFISYSHDSAEHKARVRKLADSLRTFGVECVIDQYDEMWLTGDDVGAMERLIADSGYVLVICTETYKRRMDKKEEGSAGRGATWEGALIRNLIYRNKSAKNIIPVIFESHDSAYLPLCLSGVMYEHVGDQAGFERLYWKLTDQPPDPAPAVGELMAPPTPRERELFSEPGSVQGARKGERAGDGGEGRAPCGTKDSEVKPGSAPERRRRTVAAGATAVVALLLIAAGVLYEITPADRSNEPSAPEPPGQEAPAQNDDVVADLTGGWVRVSFAVKEGASVSEYKRRRFPEQARRFLLDRGYTEEVIDKAFAKGEIEGCDPPKGLGVDRYTFRMPFKP